MVPRNLVGSSKRGSPPGMSQPQGRAGLGVFYPLRTGPVPWILTVRPPSCLCVPCEVTAGWRNTICKLQAFRLAELFAWKETRAVRNSGVTHCRRSSGPKGSRTNDSVSGAVTCEWRMERERARERERERACCRELPSTFSFDACLGWCTPVTYRCPQQSGARLFAM